jgi:hypothetical protein
MANHRDELLVHILSKRIHLYTTNLKHIPWLKKVIGEIGVEPKKITDGPETENWITIGEFTSIDEARRIAGEIIKKLEEGPWAFLENVKHNEAKWFKHKETDTTES